jgi:hypothetical protein
MTKFLMNLTVSAHRLGVESLPVGVSRPADGIVPAVTLAAKTTSTTASRSETSSFTMLHHWLANPVDAWIIADHNVGRVDENNLKIFVGSILIDPIRVQHSEGTSNTPHTLFSDAAKITLEFEFINTLIFWLSVNNSLVNRSLAATTTNGNSVDDISLS